ncbi:MAG: CinA family nicotinamide mononucleotide deamidase-related protein [Dehalococcoidales bacterium]|nr:CinA family nicotinamide mononucleotide deamidase-related protein [Dehalococcoidales bacterium]
MKAEIIATGTELLLGEVTDANTSFLAQQLAALGIDLFFTSSVGDNYERLLGALQCAWERSDVILTTGGLGPTQGDITREAIAGLFGEKMEIDPTLKASMQKFFSERGIEMTANNLKQAAVIPSAQVIPNPRGTAPGWWAEKEGRIIVAMPGPPGEMQPMWQTHVAPALQKRAGAIILSRTLKTFGLPESTVDEQLASLLKSPNPTLASYAKQDGIHLRITAKADTFEAARTLIAAHEQSVRNIVGDYIWGADDDTLETTIGDVLLSKKLSLAVAESFTGGALIQLLSHAPESGRFFKGGFFTASDEAKISLGLVWGSGGTGSIARAMASLAREKFQADIGIGIEGRSETVDNVKTAKVYIGIVGPRPMQPVTREYSGPFARVAGRIACQALFELRKYLE